MLITNQLDSLYNGVNQQPAEYRLKNQVEEMINATPTLDKGLLKRNPSQYLKLTDNISFDASMWSYAYDRGVGGDSSEQYMIMIDGGELSIVNILTGEVYNETNGLLNVTTTAKDYLYPFGGISGYSALTIKDTTFILNKNKIVRLDETTSAPTTVATSDAVVGLLSYTVPYYFGTGTTARVAPFKYDYTHQFYNGITTFNVDGQIVKVETNNKNASFFVFTYNGVQTYGEYVSQVYATLSNSLDYDIYRVYIDSTNNITIKRLDGNQISVSISINFAATDGATATAPYTDYFSGITSASSTEILYASNSNYLKEGYVWIQSANAASAYTYSVSLVDTVGNVGTFSATETTSTAAAASLATAINGDTNFSATSIGSVVKITGVNNLQSVDASDSSGNQASYGWHYEVQLATDLPKNLGFANAVVKIIGTGTQGNFDGYWLEYINGQWEETKSPEYIGTVDASTMPHTLTRNSDGTFTFAQYDKWIDSAVGDDVSNPKASFYDTTIRDIMFFKNRLGFITSRTVIFSEVGVYGNFWRTTTAALLDSDPIDTTVDTTQVISLEYALYLSDSVILFSDKSQFRLEGGRVLSPKDIQISKASSYEMNTSIRPIAMNNSIFFCSSRGIYTEVMEYSLKDINNNLSVEAVDISAQVQSYIPANIVALAYSPNENMLFLLSDDYDGVIYCYKYYNNGSERVQGAWFKYRLNGAVFKTVALGNRLNFIIERYSPEVELNETTGKGIWDDSKLWLGDDLWISDFDAYPKSKQFEFMQITPLDYDKTTFIDSFDNPNFSVIITTDINIGEWVYASGNSKDIRGHLKFKTVMISSEESSSFSLRIIDTKRKGFRDILSKYTVGRKPMIFGDAKNVRVSIRDRSDKGFKINTISYEGALTNRASKRS